MKKYLTFLAYGLLFISVPEVTNLVIINKMPVEFFGAAILYTIILSLGFLIQKYIARFIKSPKKLITIFIILFGFAGLMFEWFVIGHGPGSGAIQITMFTYWAGLFLVPYILTDKSIETLKIRNRLLNVLLVYLIIHLIISLLAPREILPALIPLLWTVAYPLFFILYYKYAREKSL